MPLAHEPVNDIHNLDAIVFIVERSIEGKHHFLVVVGHFLQGLQLALPDGFIGHALSHLHVDLLGSFSCNKIYLERSNLTDSHVVSAAQQLKIDNILERVARVRAPIAKQVVAQADVGDVILAERAEILFALDIEALDIVKQIGLLERGDVRRDGLGRWLGGGARHRRRTSNGGYQPRASFLL